MDGFDSFNSQINNFLDPLTDSTVKTALTLFLVLYGGLAAPAIPQRFKRYFDNFAFRIAILFLIIWIGNHDPGMAIGVAVAFIATINFTNNKGVFERFEGPATAIYPGCMNITVFDLLESFKNDKEALMNAMLVARVPGDVKITDYYAPLIATYLLNKGFTLKAPCAPPGVEQRIGTWV